MSAVAEEPTGAVAARPEAGTGPTGVLDRFSPATRAWFAGAFAAPTPAQVGAWEAASSGRHALVVAPTGSGKTLAAFLWSLDRLSTEAVPEEALRRCRVLYVSPLKALAVDVERNLRSPLAGIRREAMRMGLPEPAITVGVRSGDTPADERRRFGTRPPDVLITTPESLYLMLTSARPRHAARHRRPSSSTRSTRWQQPSGVPIWRSPWSVSRRCCETAGLSASGSQPR